MRSIGMTWLLITLGVARGAESGNMEIRPSSESSPQPHWSQLPIWGKDARDRGYDIPLPFGTGVNAYHEDQPFNVTDLTVAFGSRAPVDVNRFTEISQIETSQESYNFRLDAWLFPFLNVYGIAGFTTGESEGSIFIPEIAAGPVVIVPSTTVPLNISYEGPTYGGGITLAGGTRVAAWHDLTAFVVADANYTVTPLTFKNDGLESDSEATAAVFSFRLGLRGQLGPRMHGSIWGGSMVQSVDQSLEGRVPALNLRFKLDEESEAPVNALIGGRLEYGSHWNMVLEGGLGTRRSILGSLGFRF